MRDDNGRVFGTSKVIRDAPCTCGKQGYTSRKVALEYAAIARRDYGEPIHAYRCTRGGHCWHLGHPPGWRSQHPEAS